MGMIEVGDPVNEPQEWRGFGDPIAGSRWFNGVPTVALSDGEVVWNCPATKCDGTLKFNGSIWPTGTPGYHHTCTSCGFTAAIKGAIFGSPDGEDD
ncbi:hypothetical protein [Burkholderia stabilis]|uniref:hypothetical protein n=1 Tax=Burkholderia stabilis TaxID=95485 RepID=UPI001F4A8A99|nr:hypothetical protein [Burkholderia stabilis]